MGLASARARRSWTLSGSCAARTPPRALDARLVVVTVVCIIGEG